MEDSGDRDYPFPEDKEKFEGLPLEVALIYVEITRGLCGKYVKKALATFEQHYANQGRKFPSEEKKIIKDNMNDFKREILRMFGVVEQ